MTGRVEPKQFYVAHRNPSMSVEEFRANWRHHGDLAMGLPLWSNIFRYTQGDTVKLPDDVRGRLTGFDDSPDGVSTIWFNDAEAVSNIPADPDHAMLLVDEIRIFDRPVAETSLFTHEIVERDAGVANVKIVVFLSRADDCSATEFESAWSGHAATHARTGPAAAMIRSYRRNPVISLPGIELGSSTIDAYHGVTEIGFGGVDDLLVALTAPDFVDGLNRGLDGFVGSQLAMVTTELLLYGT